MIIIIKCVWISHSCLSNPFPWENSQILAEPLKLAEHVMFLFISAASYFVIFFKNLALMGNLIFCDFVVLAAKVSDHLFNGRSFERRPNKSSALRCHRATSRFNLNEIKDCVSSFPKTFTNWFPSQLFAKMLHISSHQRMPSSNFRLFSIFFAICWKFQMPEIATYSSSHYGSSNNSDMGRTVKRGNFS